MGEIDFTPTDPKENTGTLNFAPSSPTPSLAVASARAYQFQQGLNPVLPDRDVDDLHATIASGKEDDLRGEAATNLDLAKQRLKMAIARSIPTVPNPSQEALQKVSQPIQPTDPKSVAEEAWGQQFMQLVAEHAYGNMKDTTYAQAQKDIPRVVEDVKRRGGIIAAQNQTVLKWQQNAQDAIARQSGFRSITEQTLPFVPFHDEVKIRAALAPVLPGLARLGLGDYLREASLRLLSMPYDQFNQVMEDVFKPLIESNPHTAAYVLDQLLGQSTSDRYLQNFSTALDVTSIPGVGAAFRGLKGLAGLARATKDIGEATADSLTRLRWTGTEPPSLADIPEGWWAEAKPGSKEWYLVTARKAAQAAGDNKEAGIKQAADNITANQAGDVSKPKQAIQFLTSNFRLDVNKFVAAVGHGGTEVARRIQGTFEAFDNKYQDFVTNLRRTETLSDVQANTIASRIIEDAIKKNYRGVNNSIQDVVYKGLDRPTNAYRYELHIYNPDGQVFKTDIQARTNKNLNGLLDSEVVKEGMGYKLVRTVNLDEKMNAIVDLIASTDEGKLQKIKFEGSPMQAAVNRYRTSREILSFDENMQRQLATHRPAALLGLSEEALDPLYRLPKGLPLTNTRKKWGQFWRALEHSKHMEDPKDGVPGKWFETGEEMDDFFLRNFQRPADPIEKEAYVAIVRNVELNRMWDTVNLMSMKSKWGGEQHSLFAYDKDGKKISSKFVEGRIERNIEDFSLSPDTPVYVQIGRGPGVVYSWGAGKNPISKKIASGELKAIQLLSPDYRPLSDFGKIGPRRIQWAITNQVETKPLEWENQIPRRGGGHFVWDYNYYIKQAKVTADGTHHWLEGDTTLMPMSIRKMGADIVKHLNTVQTHLREGREEAAEAYHKNNNLPMSWEEHRGWYKDSNDNGVYKPARANLNEPWFLVPKDKTVADVDLEGIKSRYGKGFRDSSREGNPARQMAVQFTGERDARELMTIGNDGTRANPIYTYQPAQFADPIHVMNRALTRAVKSVWMQPMKDYSMYHWLKQAVPYMDVEGRDKLKTVMNSPAWYFNHPTWLKGHVNDPEVTKLLDAQYQMKQFIGVPSQIETSLWTMQQNLADMLYEKGFTSIPDWLMHQASDPFAYARSAVVHMKLGLFNPSAFFVQASTHLNIWGIAGPRHAGPGAAAMFLDNLARINKNPNVLAHLDKIAQGMGWRPGEWLEAHEEFARSGYYNIGHTHTFIDAHYQAKVLNSKWGSFLDAGHTPFREGARSVRTAAWYTAYHEWRHGPSSSTWTGGKGVMHSTGKLSDQDWARVQNRATDLDHNMDRASNSRLQSGLMSFPTQFQSYHLRLAELMTGKRLTWQEKLGLFTASSLAYGIPIGGLGLYSPAANFIAENIQKTAQDNGYTPNDHFVNDVFMRGLPDAMLGAAFGDQFNIAERWGPGKFNVVDDLLNGSVSWWKTISGATGTTFANMFQNASPLITAGLAFITGKSDQFPMTAEDWLRPLEEISSVSDMAGMYRTLETGRLMSKNGAYISDVSRSKYMSAFMRYVVGLTPQRAADIHDNLKWKQAEEQDYKDAEKNIIRELHAFYDAKNNNDDSAASSYMKRAMSYSIGLPQDVKTRIWTQAYKTYGKPLDMNVIQKRQTKDRPPDQAATGKEIYKKILEQQGR